jgi:hypothetical protein
MPAKKDEMMSRELNFLWRKGNEVASDLHPDDKTAHAESIDWARTRFMDFARAHEGTLARLVGVYEDSAAHKMLEKLREEFWSCVGEDTPTPADERKE